MQKIKTELIINAPISAVWKAFLEKEHWGEFSAFTDLGPGRPIEVGKLIVFKASVPGLLPIKIKAKVTVVEKEKEVRWGGGVPGFQGDHYFLFEEAGKGKTRLIHGENFSGFVAEILLRLKRTAMEDAYGAFNSGLAKRVEGS